MLIADDSVIYRSQIREALSGLSRVEVVGVASNGRLALEKIALTPVDLLILDLEMPEMDGLATLQEMQARNLKICTLVFSSTSKRGAEVTLEALKRGASDFIPKPGAVVPGSAPAASQATPAQMILQLLQPKIEAFFPLAKVRTLPQNASAFSSPSWELLQPKIVVVGSSTGGPTVLENIFSQVTGPMNCPIVITQHMPPIFTATFAERLGKISGIPAYEAKDGMVLENAIYVAPGDYHLRLVKKGLQILTALDKGPQVNSVRPAVDPLFESAAEIYKDKCLGFILTGMGADGKVGAQAVKQHGGTVVIQNEESCVVFGMPGAVFAAAAFDRIATPDQIVEILKDKVVPSMEVKRVSNSNR